MTGEEERLVGQLLEYAVEMHSKELNDYHGHDADIVAWHPRRAPTAKRSRRSQSFWA